MQIEMLHTRRVKPVDSKNGLAVKHPEVSVVTGEQAKFAWSNHMVTYNITTRKKKPLRSDTSLDRGISTAVKLTLKWMHVLYSKVDK